LFEDHLVLEWEFSDLEIVTRILGDCFYPRSYPDSEGIVDFKNLRGGQFVVDISPSQPVTLKFRTYASTLSINFHYLMQKAFVDESGDVYFETVL